MMKPIGVGYVFKSRERENLSEFGHFSKRGWPSVTDDAVGYIGSCFRWRSVNRVALIKFRRNIPLRNFEKGRVFCKLIPFLLFVLNKSLPCKSF